MSLQGGIGMRVVRLLWSLVLGLAVNGGTAQAQAASAGGKFTFFSIGDWGSGSENQVRTISEGEGGAWTEGGVI